MTEHEILELYNEVAAMSLTAISLGISVFGGYLIVLFVFLRRAPIGMRVTAYATFTAAFVLMLVYLYNLAAPMYSAVEALRALDQTGVRLTPMGADALARGRGVIDAGLMIMIPLFTGIWGLFGYMSFFYQWPDHVPEHIQEALE